MVGDCCNVFVCRAAAAAAGRQQPSIRRRPVPAAWLSRRFHPRVAAGRQRQLATAFRRGRLRHRLRVPIRTAGLRDTSVFAVANAQH